MVKDNETLFRRVRYDSVSYERGVLRLSSQAFADKGLKPSVNLASLSPDPSKTRMDEYDGVAQLVAIEVRSIDSVIKNPAAPVADQVAYKLDVVARPIYACNETQEDENLAHAQIESDPLLENRSRFDKVKDALARLAERRPLPIAPSERSAT